MKNRRTLSWTLKLLLACSLGITLGMGGLLYYQASHPLSDDPRTTVLEIEPGMNLNQVAQRLATRNLIPSAGAFRLLTYLKGKQKQIQAGEYEVSASMLPAEILKKITSGKTVLYSVTIPEGYRITEIAALLAKRGLADPDTFLRHTQDPELIRSMNIPANSLEGYLFPETYHFSKNTGERRMVQAMVSTFKERVVKPTLINRAKEMNYSFHEIITLASLVEKETGVEEERKLISAVFHNRLNKKMLLQTDPTVIYALENFDGNIRKKDLSIDSPYNTYRYRGLPPGPIANPGLPSIIAALYPADDNSLYFVSRQDGSHQFSTNLIDHNRAVRKYQLKKLKG